MENFYQIFKEIETEAPNFWKNPNNNLKETIKVFEKYGEKLIFIPSKRDLPFNLYCICKYLISNHYYYSGRNSNINMFRILDDLFDSENVFDNRFVKIEHDYDIITTKRNYKPSKETIKRYRNILFKQILNQDIYSFKYDW